MKLTNTLDDILGYQLVIASIVTNTAFEREVGKPLKLRPVEFTILQLIQQDASMNASQLAKALSISAPSMTVWIDKLVRRKLLARSKSKTDGRAQSLSLTPHGEELVTKGLQALHQSDAQLLTHLSLGERTMLLELLRKFSAGHLVAT